jgi:hypothetical protein
MVQPCTLSPAALHVPAPLRVTANAFFIAASTPSAHWTESGLPQAGMQDARLFITRVARFLSTL